MSKKDRFIIVLFLSIVIIGALTAHVSADHITAKDNADKISKAISSVSLPYEIEFTLSDLQNLGYDTENMIRPGTYKVKIKSVSYNDGLLSVWLEAWHNGNSLEIHNPWNWYIPNTISGTNNAQRLSVWIKMLIDNLDSIPYGEPIGDDAVTIYPTDDDRIYRDNVTGTTFYDLRTGIGTGITSTILAGLYSTSSSNTYGQMYRSVFSFNTSIIADNMYIENGYIRTKTRLAYNKLGNATYSFTGGSLSDNTSIAISDYQNFDSTEYVFRKEYSELYVVGTVSNWSLTSSGLNRLQQDIHANDFFITYFRTDWDIDFKEDMTWSPTNLSYINFFDVENVTESNRPFLYVVYTNVTPTPTPTPTATATSTATPTPGYTGTIPNKPEVTGTTTPKTTGDIQNWSWIKTGGLIEDASGTLIPELFSGIASFIPFMIIIIIFGILVVFVEGWIRGMR